MRTTTGQPRAWTPGATVVYLGWTENHRLGLVPGTIERVERTGTRYLVTPDRAPDTTVTVTRPHPSDRIRGGINAHQDGTAQQKRQEATQ